MAAPMAKIKQVFKVEKLNPQQEETIKSLLEQKDVFLALRTGGGKSLCYMAFPLMYSSDIQPAQDVIPQVLIISPLVSIMKEQTEFLISKGFTTSYIGKETSEDARILRGEIQFVFSSPESILQNDRWRNMLSSSRSFRLFVVDEAHTVVHW